MSRWIVRHLWLGTAVLTAAWLLLHILLFQPMGLPFSLSLPLFVFVMAVWCLVYLLCLRLAGQRAVHALEELCDPDPLLEFSREQLRFYRRGIEARRPYALSCRLNVATALTCLGRHKEAVRELDQLAALLPKKPNRISLLYCLNRSAVCFQLDQPEEMAALMDRAEAMRKEVRLPPALEAPFRFVLQTNQCAHRYLTEGPTPELEDVYRDLLEKATTQRLKVGFHLTLGKFALARNSPEEARPHLEYAAQNGGKLYQRDQAVALLASLPGAASV